MPCASEGNLHLDKAPVNLADQESLQRGARMFVNYCLNCHSASAMRYSRLQDIGLTEEQIKDNLMFAAEKPGETMKVGMTRGDAKAWFGATPPDLSVIARSRGADWLYTYLRSFYRDDTRPTGWNNIVFDKVGMPHVMWNLQGELVPRFKKDGEHEEIEGLELAKPGSVTLAEYDAMVGDLVNYLDVDGRTGPAQAQAARPHRSGISGDLLCGGLLPEERVLERHSLNQDLQFRQQPDCVRLLAF